MNTKTGRLVVLGVLSAVLLVVQFALAGLPNIEGVSLLLILYTLALGWPALATALAFVLLEGVLYGFGLWWVTYLYAWPLLVMLTMALRNMKSTLAWAVFSGLYGLFFGGLFALPYLFTGGPGAAVAYWISGIPFDLVHCAGNFAICLLLFRPLRGVLTRLAAHGVAPTASPQEPTVPL